MTWPIQAGSMIMDPRTAASAVRDSGMLRNDPHKASADVKRSPFPGPPKGPAPGGGRCMSCWSYRLSACGSVVSRPVSGRPRRPHPTTEDPRPKRTTFYPGALYSDRSGPSKVCLSPRQRSKTPSPRTLRRDVT